MKKKIMVALSFALALFTVTSCSDNEYKTYDKELNIVSLMSYSGNKDKATDLKDIIYDGKLPVKFIEGEDYIPYIDVESYYTFIPKNLSENFKYVDTEDEVDFIFELNNKKASVRIFTKVEQIVFENQLGYIGEPDEDLNTYLPLSFIDPLVNENHVSTVFYNYDKLFVYNDPAALISYKYIDNGKETTAMDEMKSKAADVMPEYLRLFNKNYLYFMLDSFYGLNEQKGITKMSTFFESLNYSKMLLSDKAEERGDALELMISSLDDSHTALLSPSIAWDEDSYKSLPQSMIKDRSLLKKILSDERDKVYKSLGLDLNGVRYSKDGKTAVITLDAFNDDNYAYDENKKVKSDEELAKTDHFFKILSNLREIDKKGGVKNIIFDMSVNSGGNSGVMTKIMNLMSKSNKANITFYDSNTNVTQTMSTQIDSNNDGKYDDNDVYGNKYKFFLLTSPVAFSCGTAMPFFVSHQDLGYIIGQNQGGGECTLNQIALPNGQIVCHSSPLHVFTFEDNNIVGDEAGVSTDLSFSYFEFYDIEKLSNKISEYEKLFK